MIEKTTFTLLEAAALLTCHPETLRRAVKSGNLRAAKIGKEYRFSKTDLEEFWTAKGGGALFEDSPRPPVPARSSAGKRSRKPAGPEQLKLPT
jgi:excisionase family DNA binding protein